MSTISIASVEKVYSCGSNTTIKWHSVKFPEFHNFAVAVDKFVGVLGESSKDDVWIPIIRKLKRIRFDFCAAPLSEEVLRAFIFDLLNYLRKAVNDGIFLMYPSSSKYLNNLIDLLEIIAKSQQIDKLLNSVTQLVNSDKENIGLLIPEPRLVPYVEHNLANFPFLRKIQVVHPNMLRDEKCYDQLIIVGPSRWYPEYIFYAPRSQNIIVIKFSWIRDSWKHEPVFTAPLKQRSGQKQRLFYSEDESDYLISSDDLLPSIDVQHIARKAEGELRDSDEAEYGVDARLFLLEDEWAVFLEADGPSTVLVIDLENESGVPVQRIKLDQLERGMYLLLRTGGGGDYIIPIADKIMGDDAEIAREFQKEWKIKLREKVRIYGYDYVEKELKLLGSIVASRQNIRNWMSMRNIKTGDIRDFQAIMKLCGLEKHTDYYWRKMRLIDNAHRRAGHQIRQMLLEQVKASDLGRLKRTGKMEFAIPGEESISITAFQVNSFSREIITVAPSRIGNPFQVDE